MYGLLKRFILFLFFLIIRLTPRSTRTYTPLPYTTLFRSARQPPYAGAGRGDPGRSERREGICPPRGAGGGPARRHLVRRDAGCDRPEAFRHAQWHAGAGLQL